MQPWLESGPPTSWRIWQVRRCLPRRRGPVIMRSALYHPSRRRNSDGGSGKTAAAAAAGSRDWSPLLALLPSSSAPPTHAYIIYTYISQQVSTLLCKRAECGGGGGRFVSHLCLFRTISNILATQPPPAAGTASSFSSRVFLRKSKGSFYFLFILCNEFVTQTRRTWVRPVLLVCPPAALFSRRRTPCEAENKKGTEPFLKNWRPDYGTSRLLTGEPQPLLNYLVALQLKDRHFDCHCIFAALPWWFTAAVSDSFWAFVLLFWCFNLWTTLWPEAWLMVHYTQVFAFVRLHEAPLSLLYTLTGQQRLQLNSLDLSKKRNTLLLIHMRAKSSSHLNSSWYFSTRLMSEK